MQFICITSDYSETTNQSLLMMIAESCTDTTNPTEPITIHSAKSLIRYL